MTDATRQRLLEIAIERFGRHGLDGTGTRAIASAAGVPMSAITYHFGGKEELYLECARHLAKEMSERMAAQVAARQARDGAAAESDDPRAGLLQLIGDFASIMMRDDVAPIARFVVREQMEPTPAFRLLFEGAMQPQLEKIQGFLRRIAGPGPTAEELRVRSVALLGQVIVFRVARAMLMRVTGWRRVGEQETERIRKIVVAHTDAICRDLAQGAA